MIVRDNLDNKVPNKNVFLSENICVLYVSACIQKQQASFYQKILEGVPGEDPSQPDASFPRNNPTYFRVAYYGQSFPAFVRVGVLSISIMLSVLYGNYQSNDSQLSVLYGNYQSCFDQLSVLYGNYQSYIDQLSVFNGNYQSYIDQLSVLYGNYQSYIDQLSVFNDNHQSYHDQFSVFYGSYQSYNGQLSVFYGKY